MVFAFLGTQEIIIILVIALLVFGPAKLPEIGKQVGSALRELNRMRSDVTRAFEFDELHRDNHYNGAYGSYNGTDYNASRYDTPGGNPDDDYDAAHHKAYGATDAGEDVETSVAAADRDRKALTAAPADTDAADAAGPRLVPAAGAVAVNGRGGVGVGVGVYDTDDDAPTTTEAKGTTFSSAAANGATDATGSADPTTVPAAGPTTKE